MNQELAENTFLALCLWRESRGESVEVKTAIAYVVMNRVSNPKWWGTDIMSVLFKPLQFSSLTHPQDKQLTTWPKSNDESWLECLQIANNVVYKRIPNPIGEANHYYDISIPAPNWAISDKFVVQLGRIKFYAL